MCLLWQGETSVVHVQQVSFTFSQQQDGTNNYCLNCLRPGHFANKYKSLSHCKQCQRPHHTLLHTDSRDREDAPSPLPVRRKRLLLHYMYVSVHSNILLMTCQVMVKSSQRMVKTRALLDTGSSASFVSERLAQALHVSRHSQNARICGIAGLQHSNGKQSVTQFVVSSACSPSRKRSINAFIIPHDLPQCAIPPDPGWNHLNGLSLADPEYDQPGKIDILLGVGIFVEVIHHGRRSRPPNSPTALNTDFGWVLAEDTNGALLYTFPIPVDSLRSTPCLLKIHPLDFPSAKSVPYRSKFN